MVHYFHGEDTYAARLAVDTLSQKENAKIRWLTHEDLSEKSPNAWLSGGTTGLFGKELLVFLDPAQLPKSTREELMGAIENNPTSPCILWDRGKTDKRDKIFRALQAKATNFKIEEPAQLSKWLITKAKEKNAKLTPEAAREIITRIGLNKWQLMNEVEKLSLIHPEITLEVIQENIPPSPEAEIFSVLDALVSGNKDKAITGVEILLQQGSSEFYILSMLAYQFRTLMLVRSGIDRGLKQFDIAREGGVKQYSIQKCWPVAQAKPFEYWRTALTRILATDFSIKQGKVDARTAVLMLVIGLMKI